MKVTFFIWIAFCCISIQQTSSQNCDFEDSLLESLVLAICDDSTDLENAPLGTNPVPFKEVSVMFHIIRDDNGDHNFQDTEEDRRIIQGYVDGANAILSDLNQSRGEPDCNHEYVRDSRIRIINRGINFYENSDFICTDTRCKPDRNQVFEYCVTKNDNLSSEEREFFFPVIIVGWRGNRGTEYDDCGRDGCTSPNACLGGVGETTYAMLRGVYANKEMYWSIVELLLEEFCHSFGLGHVRFAKACCPVWIEDHTNNLMDVDLKPPFYDDERKTLVPCQLGILHWHMEHTFRRNYLMHDLCEKQLPPITIPRDQTVYWVLEEYVVQDVYIEGTLVVQCAVHLGEGVEFVEVGNGRLFLDGGVIDDCVSVGTSEVIEEPLVVVTPNPFHDHVYFKSDRIIRSVQLYMIDGSLVRSLDPYGANSLADLSPGIYIFRVETDSGSNGVKVAKL